MVALKAVFEYALVAAARFANSLNTTGKLKLIFPVFALRLTG